MKKHLFFSMALVLFCCAQIFAQSSRGRTLAIPTSGVTVNAYAKCKVLLISYEDIAAYANSNPSQSAYAWWYVWQDRKNQAVETPYTFQNVKPGLYTLVIYDPAAQPEYGGDGLALQNLPMNSDTNAKLYFKKEDFKEWNCLSCPWMYCKNGDTYEKQTEILQDVVGREHQTTTTHNLPTWSVQNGKLKLRIQEEKDEITYIDQLIVEAKGIVITAGSDKLASIDDNYYVMKKGDILDLEYSLPEGITAADIQVKATGYYLPDEKMLAETYEKYLVDVRESKD